MRTKTQFNLNNEKHLITEQEAHRLQFTDEDTTSFVIECYLPRLSLSSTVVFELFLAIKMAKDENVGLFLVSGDKIPKGFVTLMESLGFKDHLKYDPSVSFVLDNPQDPYTTQQFLERFKQFEKVVDLCKGSSNFSYDLSENTNFESDIAHRLHTLKQSEHPYVLHYLGVSNYYPAPLCFGVIFTNVPRN